MKQGLLFGTLFIAGLILAGEIEAGTVGILGVFCMVWIGIVFLANIGNRKARSGNSEQDAITERTIKHSSILMQTDLHVKWYGGGE